MSTSSRSPSLHRLEQYNQSKSTVSSSDTDVDSAGYSSSSGTTTPEDDTKTFHLGPTFRSVLADKPKCVPRQKLLITTKHRNFSSAVKKVRQAVIALTVFKKQRPDDISPICIPSPLRERFGKRMSVKPQPDESFYSLPNRRFSFSDANMQSHQYGTIPRKFGTITGSMSSFAKGTCRKRRSGLRIPSFSESRLRSHPFSTPGTMVSSTQQGASTFTTVLVNVLRILLFMPWCAAVGGALLLLPNYVEIVAFCTGYLESPKGIRRFAHWAECAQQHVMIFLACLVVILWYNLALGLSLMGIVVSRFVFVWHAFKVDKSIPLGENDQQSLYLVVMGLASMDGSFNIKGVKCGQSATKADDSA